MNAAWWDSSLQRRLFWQGYCNDTVAKESELCFELTVRACLWPSFNASVIAKSRKELVD
jgi:hypothetical protein